MLNTLSQHIMDRFSIEILKDSEKLTFDVLDYAQDHDHNRCTFEILQHGKIIAAFEPDNRGFLHICKNCGVVEEETLHLIADKLETMQI
ncbi:MAG: hypothetical protein H7Y07_07085 [Pyrinomonadaceae bacterium]|nr:hypothetical protein [Sphingobacteriaceae bacterium]